MRFFKSKRQRISAVLFLLLFLCGGFAAFILYQDRDSKNFPEVSGTDSVSESDLMSENEAITVSSDHVISDENDVIDKTVSNDNPLSQFSKDDWRLILINKIHRVPADYTFEIDYVETSKGKMPCDKRIAHQLSAMITDAGEEGIKLIIVSPYRSVGHQKYLFNRKIRNYMNQGESYITSYYRTAQTVTIPGASEHQIGLAMDITSVKYDALNAGFGESDAGIWLAKNCWKYGFVVRYPVGKEDITGIEFEPWHFRYVGKAAAKYMTENSLCLEEFIELLEEAE